jgi:hypothetical protein
MPGLPGVAPLTVFVVVFNLLVDGCFFRLDVGSSHEPGRIVSWRHFMSLEQEEIDATTHSPTNDC